MTVTDDIVYGQGEVAGGGVFDDLLLDLYVPDVEGQERFPLVVTIHGGGFRGGSKANTAFVSNEFAQRGYIVASIDYRLSGDDPVPSSRMAAACEDVCDDPARPRGSALVAALDDTLTALEFLHVRGDVDPSQTVLWGSSAGAITALYVGFAMDDLEIDSPPVSAVISNSGGFIGALTAAGEVIDEDGSEGPIFMTHSTRDAVVPFVFAQAIVDRAEAVGHPYEAFFVEADSHGIPDGLFRTEFEPGVSVFQAQVDWLDSFLVGVAEAPSG